MNIVDVTIKLLNDRPTHTTLAKINAETGLPIQFLTRFGNGRVKLPPANDVQVLYEYLSGEKLFKVEG